MEFGPAILKATEKGSLESLQILSDHRCNLFVSTEIWLDAFRLAKRKGHHHIVKWLYKGGVVSSNVQHELIMAVAKQKLELVKFFMTFPSNNMEIAMKAVDDETDAGLVNWLQTSGWLLEMIKTGLFKQIPEESLDNGLLELIFDSPKDNFSWEKLEFLALVLFKRYCRVPLSRLFMTHTEEVDSNHPVLAKFIQLLIEFKRSQFFRNIPVNGMDQLGKLFSRTFLHKIGIVA